MNQDLHSGGIPLRKGINTNKLLIHSSFNDTLNALRNCNIKLPVSPSTHEMDFGWVNSSMTSDRVTNIEDIEAYPLDAKLGASIINDPETFVAAYDESINKYSALEGSAIFTSHSLLFMTKEGYFPLNELTMYFYTRSQHLHDLSPNIKLSQNASIDSQKDYLKDKIDLIINEVPGKSILFIDGPIIAGDVYTTFMSAAKKFFEKDIFPVFFVKNSNSNMVIDNIANLSGKYNSDLHWSHRILKAGERTCLFRYVDLNNARNTKVFCYLKIFTNSSPIRVEFFTESCEKHLSSIHSILNSIYYLSLVHGDNTNPQIRPIFVAEQFARETLKLINFNKIMKETGLQPTINQDRFAW
jgi:hypothetical protein